MEEKCRWLVRLFRCVARAGGVAAGGKVGGVPGNPVLHVSCTQLRSYGSWGKG